MVANAGILRFRDSCCLHQCNIRFLIYAPTAMCDLMRHFYAEYILVVLIQAVMSERLHAMEVMVAEAEAREQEVTEKMHAKVRDLVTRRLAEHQRCVDLTSQLAAAHELHAQLISNDCKASLEASLADMTMQLHAERASHAQAVSDLCHRKLALGEAEAKLKCASPSLCARALSCSTRTYRSVSIGYTFIRHEKGFSDTCRAADPRYFTYKGLIRAGFF